jgi:4-aminobutyrate aminotransferase-like enzyme
MSAVLSTDEIMAARPFSLPSASSSSYGGNPLASAAALVTINTILEERLHDNAAAIGQLFLEGLREIADRHPSIANVRGRGLLIGFDFVDPARVDARRDGLSAARAGRVRLQADVLMPKARCIEFFQDCLSNGLIAMSYTPRVRIHPPLILSADEARHALAIMDGALTRLEARQS